MSRSTTRPSESEQEQSEEVNNNLFTKANETTLICSATFEKKYTKITTLRVINQIFTLVKIRNYIFM